ncbi:MAG: bile acid:sodium symporter family protein [Flavobacteriaceae bacterium]|nr:bile acid:sodium symporter family protein [Flavobacteriaceae bacterium]
MDTILNNAQIAFDENNVWLLNVSLAVIMFGVALDVKIKDFKLLVVKPKPILVGFLSQFILLPALTFVLVSLVNPQPSVALGMFLIAACPGGNISNFMTKLANGNTALSICLTAFSTLLAMFITPFNFEFWGNLYPPSAHLLKTINLNPYQLINVIALILGVPLVLGMLFNSYLPTLAKKIVKPLKFISIAIFIFLVGLAIIQNFDVLKKYIFAVLLLVISHNLIAILTGYFTAKGFKLSRKNQRTLAIETGIQNSGLALLLIFTFFKGLGGMALVAATWGIWHIISGLSLGFFWANKKIK